MRPWVLGLIRAFVILAAIATCLPIAWARTEAPVAKVTIGSKNFTENRLLAEIMAQMIEAHTSIEVERRPNLGGSTIAFTALQSGAIDAYPEYTGTAWSVHLKRQDPLRDPLRGFIEVARAYESRYSLTWLAPFGFSNSYALAMRESSARTRGITRISDLLRHQDTLRAGVSHEFLNRSDGYPGLATTYGLNIADLRGMEHGLAYDALRDGSVDLIDTWTTDGKLLEYDVRLLEDDAHFFPPYDAAPVFRSDTLAKYPEIVAQIERLAFRLDERKMRELNHRVEQGGGSFAETARAFLAEEGLTGGGSPPATLDSQASSGFWPLLWSRRGHTLRLSLQHIYLVLVAVGLATLVAVPAGLLLTRKPVLAGPILGAAGVVQTIPSLALLAFLIPIPGFGLGDRSAIAALFVYAILPIIRNTYAGVHAVEPGLVDAARGMGLSEFQMLRHVELPLALPTIMAGIRTATTVSIGVATLAAFIGAGGLGDPILTGLQLSDIHLVLSGALPAASLALVVDFALSRVEGWVKPQGLA